MTLPAEKLKAWAEEGFFVGPFEKEEAFVKRVYFLKLLKTAPHAYLKDLPPSLDSVEEKDWEPLLKTLKKKLGCEPQWILTHYSNHKLSPWQGAASWIYTTPEGVKFPFVQLKKGFKRGRYLFYARDEVLSHETLHAVRSGYSESRFEEIFAYFLSKQKWRSFLGPLFRTPLEALLFCLSLFLCLGSQAYFIFDPAPWVQVLMFSPLVYLSFLSIRLMKDRRLLKKAMKRIRQLFPQQKDPFPLAFRLTDSEIALFAESSLPQLRTYIQGCQEKSLRWQQILAQYPL